VEVEARDGDVVKELIAVEFVVAFQRLALVALPGQSSTTRGYLPARAGQATHINAIANAARFTVVPRDEGRRKVTDELNGRLSKSLWRDSGGST
jgi:hypothetical protein